jgi:translation initiation factor 2 alpha subunit (eIF-2alpha)
MNNNIQTNQKNQQKVKHSTESQLTLPEWLHNIKIRFYKNKFPRQNEIVMAHIKRIDDDVGYYMELDEYSNMDALIVFREICRSYKEHDVMNTFSNNTIYPLTVNERSYRRTSNTQSNNVKTVVAGIPSSTKHISKYYNTSNDTDNEYNLTDINLDTHCSDVDKNTNDENVNNENENDENNENDNDDSENEYELDSDDETIENIDASEVNIDLSNRQLSDEEKTQAKYLYNKYKQIHSIVHNYAFALRTHMLKSDEEAKSINVDNYRNFLTDIAMKTLWKYPRDKIVDIMQTVRDNNNLIDDYFEFIPEEKKLFVQSLAKGLNKTKYELSCMLHLQTISINGINIIKTALENIDKTGLEVYVVSPPNYCIKGESGTLDKLQDKIKKVLKDTTDYMQSNFGLASTSECKITNNINEKIFNVDLQVDSQVDL